MTFSDDAIIRDLEIMSEARNYNAWLLEQFHGYCGRRIIEIGAGVGNYTRQLLDRDLIVATDVYAACVNYLQGLFRDARNVVPLRLDIASPEARSLRDYAADTIICINVLEHIKDDRIALLNMHDALVEGGRLIVLTPAFPFLFGTIDRLVGHERRYTRKELRRKLEHAGFRIISLYYMNSLGVFGWFLNNRILKRQEESPSQVAFFDRFVVRPLQRIERFIKPPFGLSLVAIVEKNGSLK